MNRFFVDKENIFEEQGKVLIDELEDINHITKVLRLTIGDEIEICNKEKREYKVLINGINKKEISCKIKESYPSQREASIEVVLFQSIPKASKMDLIIQKNVEIGVDKIVPVISHRCVAKIKDKSSEMKKIERWQRIAQEAAKQCKRGIISKIENAVEFSKLRNMVYDLDMVLIPYEEEKSRGIKKSIINKGNIKKIGIIIGPEGGFTEEEILEAEKWGCLPISLGPRILRTETAGLVTTSILMYELGDLGGK